MISIALGRSPFLVNSCKYFWSKEVQGILRRDQLGRPIVLSELMDILTALGCFTETKPGEARIFAVHRFVLACGVCVGYRTDFYLYPFFPEPIVSVRSDFCQGGTVVLG